MGRVLKAGTFDYPTVMHFFYCEKETKKKLLNEFFLFRGACISCNSHEQRRTNKVHNLLCDSSSPFLYRLLMEMLNEYIYVYVKSMSL